MLSHIEVEVDRTSAPVATAAEVAPAPDGAPAWFNGAMQEYINRLDTRARKPGGGAAPKAAPGAAADTNRTKKARFTFIGCWHCGISGHARGGCPAFQKLMADANKGNSNRDTWKLPKGYMGAFEKAKKKALGAGAGGKKRVNMLDGTIAEQPDTEGDEWEDSDSDMMGSDYGQSVRALRVSRDRSQGLNLTQAYSGGCKDRCCALIPDIEPENLDDLMDTLEEDDIVEGGELKLEEETHAALKGWAHRTFIEVKKRSKHKPKTCAIHSAEDLDKMLEDKNKVAKMAVRSSTQNFHDHSHLPNVELEEDEMLALVDSGSTLNAAHIAKHFKAYINRIITSRAQAMGETATTAGGHELVNKGRCRIEATVDGVAFPVPFQNMEVDVPILSVRKYMQNGYDFHFTEDGGHMVCRLNNKVFKFIEADGAFWIKLKVQQPPNELPPSPVFSRPGKF